MEKKVNHIGFILDGNRRWAREQGLPPWRGHEAACEKITQLEELQEEFNIKEATLYTFSMQNFKRDPDEIKHLMMVR